MSIAFARAQRVLDLGSSRPDRGVRAKNECRHDGIALTMLAKCLDSRLFTRAGLALASGLSVAERRPYHGFSFTLRASLR